MKSIILKINGETFEYEIKVQALKDTGWMKPHYLARFFFVLKVSNNRSFCLLIGFVLLNCSKKGAAFCIAAVIFIFWDFLMFYRIFLSPQVKQCTIITYTHGIYGLPHQLPNYLRLMTNQQGSLRGVLSTFMHQFGWWYSVHPIIKP